LNYKYHSNKGRIGYKCLVKIEYVQRREVTMKVMINILLGRRLRKIRKILGVSSEDMAEALEVSVGHFQKLERGDHAFSLERLKVLREHYGIDLNYLVTGRSKEEDIARDLIYGTPEETFYFMHQLLDSCERMYLRRISEEGEL
jgi:Predicted transcriptional regulator with C-terminal CBS domains